MKKRPALSTICISMLVCLAGAAASPAQEGCFEAHYDAAHLAANPEQVVERLALHFTPDTTREGTAYVELRALMARQGHALRRGTGGMVLEEFGLCDPDGICRIACDGGSFRILVTDADTVEIETADARVAAQPCTSGTVISTLAEAPGETSTFRLSRTSANVCGR